MSALYEVTAAYEERIYMEVHLPRVWRAVGEMDEKALRKALDPIPDPNKALREAVAKKLTREVMPAHLRATLEAEEVRASSGNVNPVPDMKPETARALVAFFNRPHDNPTWMIVWKDFEAIRLKAREAERA